MAPTSIPAPSETLYDAAVIGAGPTGLACAIEIEKKGFKAIVNGEYDHLPEQAFYMVGSIEEAVEKAKTL